jgi:hypothetical protein
VPRSSSKTAPQTREADGGGNASVAIRALVELRRNGFEPHNIAVGDVTISLMPSLRSSAGQPDKPRPSIVQEYGGPAISKLLAGGDAEPDEAGLVPA